MTYCKCMLLAIALLLCGCSEKNTAKELNPQLQAAVALMGFNVDGVAARLGVPRVEWQTVEITDAAASGRRPAYRHEIYVLRREDPVEGLAGSYVLQFYNNRLYRLCFDSKIDFTQGKYVDNIDAMNKKLFKSFRHDGVEVQVNLNGDAEYFKVVDDKIQHELDEWIEEWS